MRLRIAAPVLVVVVAAACGSSHRSTKRFHYVPIRFRAVLHAPTHTPKAGKPWLYSVRVTFDSERGASGFKPLASASNAANNCAGTM